MKGRDAPPDGLHPGDAPGDEPLDGDALPDLDDGLLEQAVGWQLLHDLFRPPDPDQWDWLRLPPVTAALALLGARSGLGNAPLPMPESYDAYQSELLAAFDVGLPHPPCPLLESHWNRAVDPNLIRQRNLRFFEQFGLRLRSADGSPPDHLRHQLELMRYLCLLERERRNSGQAEKVAQAAQLAQGRAEFLRLHLMSWVPAAAESLSAALPDSWPSGWMELLVACLGREAGSLDP